MRIPDTDLMRETLAAEGETSWADAIRRAVADHTVRHGELPRWEAALERLPRLPATKPRLDQAKIGAGSRGNADTDTVSALRQSLLALSPWRKGPFEIHGVLVDAEWRSDQKWSRLAPHISDLGGRRILDVGCGNGYYALRMLGRGARWVLGADPGILFSVQYRAFRHYTSALPFWLLPTALEHLPEPTDGLDTVFSMGVLYHRRSPFAHLERLRRWLRPGGELVLETIIVKGDENHILLPRGRYARMRNVWFLPSVPALLNWLARAGFRDARCVDVTPTTFEEQRTTEWMPFESLREALRPDAPKRTVEGYPAPVRAIIIANRS